jgi:hypothetical protein
MAGVRDDDETTEGALVKGGASKREQRWGVWDLTKSRFAGVSERCGGTYRDADGTARYLNERAHGFKREPPVRYEARLIPL